MKTWLWEEFRVTDEYWFENERRFLEYDNNAMYSLIMILIYRELFNLPMNYNFPTEISLILLCTFIFWKTSLPILLRYSTIRTQIIKIKIFIKNINSKKLHQNNFHYFCCITEQHGKGINLWMWPLYWSLWRHIEWVSCCYRILLLDTNPESVLFIAWLLRYQELRGLYIHWEWTISPFSFFKLSNKK